MPAHISINEGLRKLHAESRSCAIYQRNPYGGMTTMRGCEPGGMRAVSTATFAAERAELLGNGIGIAVLGEVNGEVQIVENVGRRPTPLSFTGGKDFYAEKVVIAEASELRVGDAVILDGDSRWSVSSTKLDEDGRWNLLLSNRSGTVEREKAVAGRIQVVRHVHTQFPELHAEMAPSQVCELAASTSNKDLLKSLATNPLPQVLSAVATNRHSPEKTVEHAVEELAAAMDRADSRSQEPWLAAFRVVAAKIGFAPKAHRTIYAMCAEDQRTLREFCSNPALSPQMVSDLVNTRLGKPSDANHEAWRNLLGNPSTPKIYKDMAMKTHLRHYMRPSQDSTHVLKA